jgi:predicted permease
MKHLRRFLSKWMSQFRKDQMEAELKREINAHLALIEEDFRGRGLSTDEARLAARRAYGGVEQAKQMHRDERSILWLEALSRDFRFALRQLRKSPGFALTSVLTLALGIGAVTSVFSVVDGVLLKPFAFRDPDRLVVLREAVDGEHGERSAIPVNYRHFLRLKSTATTLADAAIFSQRGASVSPNGDHPQIVGAVLASPNLFQLLGVQPMLGRSFIEADADKGAEEVVLLSYAGWQTLFGADPKAVGRTLRIDGQPVTIIGVMPPDMRFPQIALAQKIAFQETASNAMLFEPLVPSERDLKADMGNFNYKAIARLKQGATPAQAIAEMDALQKAYTISAHLPLHFGIALTPLTKDVGSGVSGALWLMFAAVGAVLLIACVNLANLQMARAVNAEHETAVRSALGASKTQLIWSRLTESMLLALVGGAAGAGLAFAGVRLLLALVPASVPRLDEVRVNTPVLLFAAGISIVAAIAFGVLPALKSVRVHPQAALQANSTRTANTQEGRRTRNAMVAAQVACTVILLIVTSLALRSFSNLMHQNRGFDSSHITFAQVDLFTPQYDADGAKGNVIRLALADRTLRALGQLPGVQSVAITSVTPLTGETWVDNLFRPDHPVPAGKEPMINVRWINPDYLPTMGSPLIAGRNITAADRANPYVALISERTAREAFFGENPVGRTLINIVPDDKHPVTIIGVVANTRINGLKDDAAMVYLPYWAYTPLTLSFLVRSSQPSDVLIAEMRRAIWQIDPQLAIPTLKSLDDQVRDSVSTDRFQALVLTSFGAAALLLALLGIYGVLAYSVSLRKQEFGIRIALGSGKGALIKLVVLQGSYPVLLGTGIGLTMVFGALRWVGSMLYRTAVIDPIAIGGSVVLVLAAAALATIIPACRAASSHPMRALRME